MMPGAGRAPHRRLLARRLAGLVLPPLQHVLGRAGGDRPHEPSRTRRRRRQGLIDQVGVVEKNDYDKEVYNGDIGYVDDVDLEAGELIASSTVDRSRMGLANSTRWSPPTPPPSTRARAPSIPPWLSRS